MGLVVGAAKSFVAYMGINLSCREATMPQEFLDAPQISASVEQVGGITMPEGVGAGPGVEIKSSKVAGEQATDTACRKSRAVPVQKKSVFIRLGR